MKPETELCDVRLNLGRELVTLPVSPEMVMIESANSGTFVLIVAVITFWPPGLSFAMGFHSLFVGFY